MVRSNRRRSRRPPVSRGGRSNKRGRGGATILQPPRLVPTMKLSHRFRFTTAANNFGGGSITRKNLLNLMLYTPTAITSVRLMQAVRLKRVQIWTNPSVLGAAPVICAIEWLGQNAPSTLVEDTSMGIRPAHVDCRPPPSSSDRWWSISGFLETDVLFNLTAPPNSVIDVTVEIRFVEAEAPTAGDVPAGAIIGQLYGNYLDGLASGLLAPAGYVALP
jgi:hypothetical protein